MIMIAGGSREDYRAQVILGKVVVGSIFGKAKAGSIWVVYSVKYSRKYETELSGRIQQPPTKARRPGD